MQKKSPEMEKSISGRTRKKLMPKSSFIQTVLSASESHRIMPCGSWAVPPVGNSPYQKSHPALKIVIYLLTVFTLTQYKAYVKRDLECFPSAFKPEFGYRKKAGIRQNYKLAAVPSLFMGANINMLHHKVRYALSYKICLLPIFIFRRFYSLRLPRFYAL